MKRTWRTPLYARPEVERSAILFFEILHIILLPFMVNPFFPHIYRFSSDDSCFYNCPPSTLPLMEKRIVFHPPMSIWCRTPFKSEKKDEDPEIYFMGILIDSRRGSRFLEYRGLYRKYLFWNIFNNIVKFSIEKDDFLT